MRILESSMKFFLAFTRLAVVIVLGTGLEVLARGLQGTSSVRFLNISIFPLVYYFAQQIDAKLPWPISMREFLNQRASCYG